MKTSPLFISFILFFSTIASAQKKEDNVFKIKLIEYVVQIADTSKQVNEIDLTEHQLLNEMNYFNLLDFKNFCFLLKSAMNDSTSIIADDNKPYNVISKKDLANQMFDTLTVVVPSMDDGNDIYHKVIQEVNFSEPRFLRFYETWLINTKTFEIKKEIIAYAPLFYDETLNLFKSRYILFTNLKSHKLFQELMSNVK